MNNTAKGQPNNQEKAPKIRPRRTQLPKILVGLVSGIITLFFLVWFNFPVNDMIHDQISRAYTPTPHPPTATLIPTRTPTITPSPTIPPSPTQTSLPPSAFRVTDVMSVDPPIPGGLLATAVILNDDVNATVSPDFTNMQWIPSSRIAEQIGREIVEPYYATFGPGSITWKMDTELDPAFYQIFVLDTLYSSGGILNFTVSLGDNTPLIPLIGMPRVEYHSSQAVPQQRANLWHSIGVYDLTPNGLLSVSTKWEARNEQTIVAVDRILILRLPDYSRIMLNQLPKGRQIFLVDDAFANFETDQYWEAVEKSDGWGDQYFKLENPPISSSVTWKLPYAVPVAQYEVMAWIPKIKGTVDVTYKVFASDATGMANPLQNEKNETSITLSQGNKKEGHWISLGNWGVPSIYGDFVYLSTQMEFKNDTVGEVAADAIVFIKAP